MQEPFEASLSTLVFISFIAVIFSEFVRKNFRITPYIYYACRIINYVTMRSIVFQDNSNSPLVLNIYIDNCYLLCE